MQITIDIEKILKKGLSVNEYLTMLSIYWKGKNITIPYVDRKVDYFSLQQQGFLTIDGSIVQLTAKAMALIGGQGRNYVDLAIAIREQFPKGSKAGKYPWKGTAKSIVEKLKKLDKSFDMSNHSSEEIVKVVQKYVNRFTSADMDRGMQIAPYFIEKDGESSLMAWLQMEPENANVKSTEIKL